MNPFRRLSQSILGAGKSIRDYSHYLFSPKKAPRKPATKQLSTRTPAQTKRPSKSTNAGKNKGKRTKSKRQLRKENEALETENRRLREANAKRPTRRTAEGGGLRRPLETPRKRYPYLVAGSTNAKAPENLVATYPTEEMLLARYHDLERGGFNEAMLCAWAARADRFELYVGYDRKANSWLQRHI